jgi:hypothetical protein
VSFVERSLPREDSPAAPPPPPASPVREEISPEQRAEILAEIRRTIASWQAKAKAARSTLDHDGGRHLGIENPQGDGPLTASLLRPQPCPSQPSTA